MENDFYSAKEVSSILKTSVQTVYRKAKSGELPSVGKRPNIKFPKRAIDAIKKVGAEDDKSDHMTFSPSTIADAWFKQEVNHFYDNEDSVPFETVLEWRKKNNEIGMNVKLGDKIIGWATFLPMEETVILDIINNKIREKDIRGYHVKKWNEKRLSVYIPIIEVIPSGDEKKDRRRGVFLIKNTIKWALLLTIQYDIQKWYAMGTSPEGQAILEAAGFKNVTSFDKGARKGYVLNTKAEPVRLLSHFIESISEETPQIENKARSKITRTKPLPGPGIEP